MRASSLLALMQQAAPVSLTCSKLSVKSARLDIPDALPSQPPLPVLLFMYQLTL